METPILFFLGIFLLAAIAGAQDIGRIRRMMILRDREIALRRAFPFGPPTRFRGRIPPGVAARIALEQRRRGFTTTTFGGPTFGGPPGIGRPFMTGANNQFMLGPGPRFANGASLAALGLGNNALIGGGTTFGVPNGPMTTIVGQPGPMGGIQTGTKMMQTNTLGGVTGTNTVQTTGQNVGQTNMLNNQGMNQRAGFPNVPNIPMIPAVAPNQGGNMQNNQNMNTNMNTNMNNVNTNMNNMNTNMNNMNTNMNNMNTMNTNMNNMNTMNPNMNTNMNPNMNTNINPNMNTNMNTNMNPNMMQPGMNTQSFTLGTSPSGMNNVAFQGNSAFTSSPNTIFPSQVAQGPVIRQRRPGFNGGMQFPAEPQIPQIPEIPNEQNGPVVTFPSGIQRFGPNEQQQMFQERESLPTNFQGQTQFNGQNMQSFSTSGGIGQPQTTFGNQFQFGNNFGFPGPEIATELGPGMTSGQNFNVQFQPLPSNNINQQNQFGQNQNQMNTITNQNSGNTQVTTINTQNNNPNTNTGTIQFNTGSQNVGTSATSGQSMTGSTTNDQTQSSSSGEFKLVEVGNILASPDFAKESTASGTSPQDSSSSTTSEFNAAFINFPADAVQDLSPQPQPLTAADSVPVDTIDTTNTATTVTETKVTKVEPLPVIDPLKQDFSFFVTSDTAETGNTGTTLTETNTGAETQPVPAPPSDYAYDVVKDIFNLPNSENDGMQTLTFPIDGPSPPSNQLLSSSFTSFTVANNAGENMASTNEVSSLVDKTPPPIVVPTGIPSATATPTVMS